MSFMDTIKSMFGTNTGKEQDDSKIVIPEEYLIEFQNGMEGKLQLIEAQLFRIENVYSVGAEEIKKKIAQIRQDMENNVSQTEIEEALEELEKIERAYTEKANQRYSIEQVKRAILRIKRINLEVQEEWNSSQNAKGKLEKEEQYISSVTDRIADFKGQERDNLIGSLMEARYRIKIGKMLIESTRSTKIDMRQFFTGVPEVEKVMYDKFLMADINELIERFNRYFAQERKLEQRLEQVYLEYPEMERIVLKSKTLVDDIGSKIERLQDEFYNDLMDDFQITGLFSKENFLLNFADICLKINSLEQEIDEDKQMIEDSIEQERELQEERQRKLAQAQEQERRENERIAAEEARKKELEERCKSMTDTQIQAEIRKIDSQIFDMKEKYRKTIEFQIMIAKIRGLIGEKETMENEGIEFLASKTSEVPSLIESLNQNHIFNTAMIGVDDDRTTSIIMIAKSDRQKVEKLKKKEEKKELEGYYKGASEEQIGHLNLEVLKLMPKGLRDRFRINKKDSRFAVNESGCYISERCIEAMERLYELVLGMNEKEGIKENIKFYIQLPLQRSMLPVIQELQQAEIEFYIPPVNIPNFEFKKSEPSYRIYIDRRYLEIYKEQVHSKLSKAGVVLIGDKNLNLATMMLEDCEFPYNLDKQQER